MNHKVLITASGRGARLGEITDYTNKTLVKVGKKPAISYIVESYPKETEFIVTLGHYGDHVRDYLDIAHPKSNIKFVKVDKYEGPGSSLLYSMLKTKDYLQSPFIYHASDTIVDSITANPNKNWVFGYKGEPTSHYASFNTLNNKVVKIHEMGEIDPEYIYVGLLALKDFKAFWHELNQYYLSEKHHERSNDTHVVNKLIDLGIDFHAKECKKWHDTGNVESLAKARQEIDDSFHILDKLEESIFLHDKHVVKFFHDKKMVEDRVKRGKILKGLVPKILKSKNNFYQYEHVKGDLYSDVANPKNFVKFLVWANDNLWKPVKEVEQKEFKKICYDFYYTKTIERVEKFQKTRSIKDKSDIINDEKVPSLKEMFKMIDFDWISNAEQSHFHGDFILDNIIKTKSGYCLLDWRQNFGGLSKAGDMYYDLSKLNHNLTVNHGIVNDNLFTIEIGKNEIKCDILRKNNLVICQDILSRFIIGQGYDIKKVKILTALIWLNMSPLHHHPLDQFLYYFGKLNLYKALQK